MDQDTSPAQRERYFERLRALTFEQKFQMVASLNRGVRRLAIAGIKLRHPDASDREVEVRLFVRIHGRELASRFFKDIPADAI